MTSTWQIENLRYRTSDGTITHLNWKLTSSQGDVTLVKRGSVYLSGTAVIPFSMVTHPLTLVWLTSYLTTDVKDAMQAKLESEVSAKVAGDIAVGTPDNW